MKLRSRLFWANVGASVVVVTYIFFLILGRFNQLSDQVIYMVLIEPHDPLTSWGGISLPLPRDLEKRLNEEEKLRDRAPEDFLYVSRVAHDCGAPEQQMSFPLDAPSDVLLPLKSLSANMLVCIVTRANREKIDIDFRSDQNGKLPFFEVSNTLNLSKKIEEENRAK